MGRKSITMLFFDGEGLSHCEDWVSDMKDDSGEDDRNGSSSLLLPSRRLPSARSKDGGEMAKRIKRSRKREELSAEGDAVIENEFMTHGTIKEDDEVVEGSRTGLGKGGGEKIALPSQQPLSKKKKKLDSKQPMSAPCNSFCPGRLKNQEKTPIEVPDVAVADYVQGPTLEKSRLHISKKKKRKKRTHERQNHPAV